MNAFDPTWPDFAVEFVNLYAATERKLKLAGFVKKGRRDAQADWTVLAEFLGAGFFEQVKQAGEVAELIAEPPRIRMADSLEFEPEHPAPLASTSDLFLRGISKVRNNLIHGEKFNVSGSGRERDERLVQQALRVLATALQLAERPGALLAETPAPAT